MRSETSTPPGSRSTTTRSPRSSSAFASPATSVDLPAPSSPSTVISRPRQSLHRHAGLASAACSTSTRTPPPSSAPRSTARPRTRICCTARPGAASATRRATSRPRCWRARRPIPSRRGSGSQHGTHPDLTWVAPSGAHEMLRRDVDEAVVSAASRTPFEAAHRVFVLERADTMNDEAANSLLKTLEEPPPYVRPAPAHRSPDARCCRRSLALPAGALRPAAAVAALAQRLQSRGVAPERPTPARGCRSATASGRSRWRSARARRCAPRAEAFARAPLAGRADAERPWRPLLESRRARRGDAAKERSRPRSPRSSSTCPRRSTSGARPSSPSAPGAPSGAPRPARSTTRSSSPASGTATLACVAAGAPELVHHSRPPRRAARGRRRAATPGALLREGRARRRHPRAAARSTSARSWRSRRSPTGSRA